MNNSDNAKIMLEELSKVINIEHKDVKQKDRAYMEAISRAEKRFVKSE